MAENDISNRDVATIVNMNLSFQTSYVLSILLTVGVASSLIISKNHALQVVVFAVWVFEIVNCIRKGILLELMVKRINRSSEVERKVKD